jgi:lysophospholipase L1-like esterase
MTNILALGDCNTLGVKSLKGSAYPEKFARTLGKTVKNCGFTMSTTQEMLYLFEDFKGQEKEIVLIQYGLVDSWKTFKYAPYVLYYPENSIRKIFRKIVKKYKKIAKNMGLNKLLGVSNVVALDDYRNNIKTVLQETRKSIVFLIDTIPNLEISRNNEIMRYNQVLSELSNEYEHVHYVEVYDDFLDRPKYYLDNTHMNEKGYEQITQKILSVYLKSRES